MLIFYIFKMIQVWSFTFIFYNFNTKTSDMNLLQIKEKYK